MTNKRALRLCMGRSEAQALCLRCERLARSPEDEEKKMIEPFITTYFMAGKVSCDHYKENQNEQ